VIATAALVVAAAGVTYAAIPDPVGVIHGCYDTTTGALRVIDPPTTTCTAGRESALDWSQQGPAGSQGAQGPPGSAGPAGPAGVTTAYTSHRGDVNPVQVPNEHDFQQPKKTVLYLDVPAGSYVVWAKARAVIPSGSGPVALLICRLAAGQDLDYLELGTRTLPLTRSVHMHLLHRFESKGRGATFRIRLLCSDREGEKSAQNQTYARVSLYGIRITAIPVASFTSVSTY
jgi:hypothetical protein